MILIFDAYGTLVELDDFYGRLARGFASRGTELTDEIVTRAARREMHHYIQHSSRANCATSHAALHRECAKILRNALQELEPNFSLEIETTSQILAEAIVFRLFPETREVLETLAARGLNLGVASNWDYTLPSHLEALGIAPFFQFILSSAELGAEKPSPQFFDLVRREAQQISTVLPIIYIGDHYEKDVVASACAGFKPLWLVRDERDVASGEKHEAEGVIPLRSLDEIFAHI